MFALIFMFIMIYGARSLVLVYTSIAYENFGYTGTLLGVLLAVGPLTTFASQPLWGTFGDKAKTKNSVIFVAGIGACISAFIFTRAHSFWPLFLSSVLVFFFMPPMQSVGESIALESGEKAPFNYYSLCRAMGSFGFASSGLVVSLFFTGAIDTNIVFYFFIVLTLLALAALLFAPKVKGHQAQGNKRRFTELFRYKKLVLVVAFVGLIYIAQNVTFNFFAVYFVNELGASSTQLAIHTFFAVLAEVPLLLLANKIIKKAGVFRVLVAAALILCARCLILALIPNVSALLLLSFTQGCANIPLLYCGIITINNSVPDELKASGQGFWSSVVFGLSAFFGNIAGGVLLDLLGGFRNTYLFLAVFIVAVIVLFAPSFIRAHKGERLTLQTEK